MTESTPRGAYLEILRRPEQLAVPDTRSVQATGLWGCTQERLFQWMHAAELRGSPPQDVREVYDVARNLFQYSWFQFRFSMVAVQQAIAAVELALRMRFVAAGVDIKTQRGSDKTLRPLLEDAVRRGWITDAGFREWLPSHLEPSSGEGSYSHSLTESLPKIRNFLAHGSASFLDQAVMKDFIGRSGAMIDQLFPAT